MKAEDTVLSRKIHEIDTLCEERVKQASISFKAGVKEVVEWINEHSNAKATYTDDLHMTRRWLEMPIGLWQAKLKEWGIEHDKPKG